MDWKIFFIIPGTHTLWACIDKKRQNFHCRLVIISFTMTKSMDGKEIGFIIRIINGLRERLKQ